MSTIWATTNNKQNQEIRKYFSKHHIDFSCPGFCDSPEFLSVEQKHPKILEDYARYIDTQKYSEAYIHNARKKIEVVSSVVRQAVEIDGRLGACVDASGIIGRMLDELGVWNYVPKVTLTVEFPAVSNISTRYFWVLDEGEFTASHAVVVAPPFGLIDVTIKHQHYSSGEKNYLPELVLCDKYRMDKWEPEDIANGELRQYLRNKKIGFKHFLKINFPHLLNVMNNFPAKSITMGGTKIKYVTVAIGGFQDKLPDITGYKPCGRTALDWFNNDVIPKL